MALAPGSRALVLLRVFIVVSFLLANIAQAKSFLKADLTWTGLRKANENLQPNLTDLLAFRDLHQDPVLKKAMVVIDNLAIQSTCHQAAATQLLITCKAVDKDLTEEQGKHELLERAKSVYAVRLAVCETGEGRAAIPVACKSVLKIPNRLDGEVDVVDGKLLSTCLESMMSEHYYWTSYSNNRQDANTLCQAGSLESTRLEALRSYTKLAELIPEFREALLSSRSQWLSFMKQQEEDARNLNKLQQANKAQLKEQHEIELGAFRRAMNVAKEGLDEVSRVFHQSVAKTGSGIGQTHEALEHVLTDFATLKNLLADVIQTTLKNNAEIAAVQAQDIHSVHELALATTEVLKGLQASEVAQEVNGLFHRVKLQLDHVLAKQAVQLTSAENQLILSKELSESQKASLSLGEQMKGSSASLASELDNARIVAGRVSSKLDKVNQALTRVEKASSILTSISAVLSIPCQFVEHLHLRLLVFFATPATVLSFWKPRQYSYSLMAIYAFLESLISLVTEYHGSIIGTISQLGWVYRGVTTLGFEFLSQHIFKVAALVAVVACFVGWKYHKASKSDTLVACNVISRDKDLTIADRYYMEYHARNGKLGHDDSDRYRRAATVC